MRAGANVSNEEFIRTQFRELGNIDIVEMTVRAYPDETNYIVFVREADVPRAAEIGNELDSKISVGDFRAFVIVRKASNEQIEAKVLPLSQGVQDSRATDLVHLIAARSRVSEVQPSLSYVRDVEFNLSAVTATRHHFIFGRRGAGKSALLVEARRSLKPGETLSCWLNMQTYRAEPPNRVFAYIIDELLSQIVSRQQQFNQLSSTALMATDLYDQVRSMLTKDTISDEQAMRLVPGVQRTIRRFIETSGLRIYIFIDDFYYLPRSEQPRLLDMLHGCVRDCDAWLKIASIRHLTRWWQSNVSLGLQTIHDADHLDLDVTLQDPSHAKKFLERILQQYVHRVGVSTLNRLFHGTALDRLVLASGAVPRDYLLLASNAITKAQHRPNAKLVGVQDVNQAAGDAAQVKVQELEEDMASSVDSAARTLEALKRVRAFCLDEKNHTYFLIGYREKEMVPQQYNVLTDLLDLRLIHLLDGGVSDPHSAGHRFEAFMLDLSQFSGSRLKQGIRVLDFSGGKIVSLKTRERQTKDKQTRDTSSRRVGDTPLKVIAILRTAPEFPLERFSDIADI
jgi:hypothetical protein